MYQTTNRQGEFSMKKLIINIASLLLLLSIFISSPVSASSHFDEHESSEVDITTGENGDIELLYIPCPEGGKHIMKPRGAGTVYINGVRKLDGRATQCEKCGDVIISEFNPYDPATTRLGKYGYANYNYTIGTGTYMYTNTLYESTSWSDPFLQSFIFQF